jgi:hypothetical protein
MHCYSYWGMSGQGTDLYLNKWWWACKCTFWVSHLYRVLTLSSFAWIATPSLKCS